MYEIKCTRPNVTIKTGKWAQHSFWKCLPHSAMREETKLTEGMMGQQELGGGVGDLRARPGFLCSLRLF